MKDFDRSLHNNWDRQLEGGLPDSRLSGPRRRATTVPRGRMLMDRVFCANCGCDGGLVTADWAAHVFYLCDECSRLGGGLPLVEVPEALVRGE